jgi:hypothetical protein
VRAQEGLGGGQDDPLRERLYVTSNARGRRQLP